MLNRPKNPYLIKLISIVLQSEAVLCLVLIITGIWNEQAGFIKTTRDLHDFKGTTYKSVLNAAKKEQIWSIYLSYCIENIKKVSS